METENPFKVIVVGAGVAGITMAHCLSKAGIDFVLLDKGVVGPSFGTTITLQPHGCRVLHQLGVLDEVLASCSFMGGASVRDSNGKCFAHNEFFHVVKEQNMLIENDAVYSAGYDTRTVDRQGFLKTMYRLLPDQSCVHEHTRVVRVLEQDSLVRVFTDDEREFVGDLVVGTDGVHSKMREIMWDAANTAVPNMINVNEQRAMKTTYKAIVALARPMPGLSQHDMEITSHDKLSFLLLCQPDWISYIVHCKLPEAEQCSWPHRKRFSEAEMNVLAESIASLPVTESVVFGKLWQNTTKAQMISLEEGVLDHWQFGRIALAGDAIHKVTPNSALGGNTGIEDVVSITNTLHALLRKHPNMKPKDNEMRDALQDYQDSRLDRVKAIVKLGGDMTRMQAYDGFANYATQRWMTPYIGLDTMAKGIAELASGAPKLAFVDIEGEVQGKIAWKDTAAARASPTKSTKPSKLTAILGPWSRWDGTFESLFPFLLFGFPLLGATVSLFLFVHAGASVPGFAAIAHTAHVNTTLSDHVLAGLGL